MAEGPTDNRGAGLFAAAAAAIALVAVAAIILSGGRGDSSGNPLPLVVEGPERGIGSAAAGLATEGSGTGATVGPGRPDAGAGPEAGIRVEPELGPDGEPVPAPSPAVSPPPSPPRPVLSAEELERMREEAAAAAARLTPEQRYRALSFFEDFVILRLDQVRAQVAAAREANDERALAQLEPTLAILEVERVRASEHTRALERELGLSPEPPSDEPDEPGANDEPPPGP